MSYDMPRGFPRPRDTAYGFPTPYTADSINSIASSHSVRNGRCNENGWCSVCGLELDEYSYTTVMQEKMTVSFEDTGIMHDNCAQMTLQFCPEFAKGTNGLYRVKSKRFLTKLLVVQEQRRSMKDYHSTIPIAELMGENNYGPKLQTRGGQRKALRRITERLSSYT